MVIKNPFKKKALFPGDGIGGLPLDSHVFLKNGALRKVHS